MSEPVEHANRATYATMTAEAQSLKRTLTKDQLTGRYIAAIEELKATRRERDTFRSQRDDLESDLRQAAEDYKRLQADLKAAHDEICELRRAACSYLDAERNVRSAEEAAAVCRHSLEDLAHDDFGGFTPSVLDDRLRRMRVTLSDDEHPRWTARWVKGDGE